MPYSQVDWRNRLERAIGDCYVQIAQEIAGRDADMRAKELTFAFVKASDAAISVTVQLGDAKYFVKVFDAEGPEAADRYKREKAALLVMRGSGLVVRLRAFSDAHRFVMMTHEERGLDQVMTSVREKVTFARRLGIWVAEFDRLAPASQAQGDWYSYLSGCTGQVSRETLLAAKERLSAVPLAGLGLARNDAALHNYLIGADGMLLGCDFEKSAMRPRGWDYVATYQALLHRFTENAEAVLEAFEAGFSRAHRGGLLVEELNGVARDLFCARAMARHSNEGAE